MRTRSKLVVRSVLLLSAMLCATLLGAPTATAWGVPHHSVRQTGGVTEVCGVQSIRAAEGTGPATLHLSVSDQVAVEVSATVGVSDGTVSAGLGMKVSGSRTVSSTFDYPVSEGTRYRVTAYPMYEVRTFDVYYSPAVGKTKKVGTGEAWRPFDVCFVPQRLD